MKVVRASTNHRELESDDEDRSVFDLNEEFTTQILSGVRFAPLQVIPAVATVIPANVWSPTMQRGYPIEFKLASRQLLLCSNSQLVQAVIIRDERVNAAALLPKTIWIEILSYTHRKCKLFEYNAYAYQTTHILTTLHPDFLVRVCARIKRD